MNRAALVFTTQALAILVFTTLALAMGACGDDDAGSSHCASLRFNGGDHVAIKNSAAFDLGSSLTLAAWVKLDSGHQAALVDSGLSGDYCGPFGLQVGKFGQLVLGIRGGQGSLKCEPKVTLSADSPLPVGTWVHVAAVVNGGAATLFRDGYQIKSATATAVDPYPPVHDIWLGAEDGPHLGLKGKLANVAIWNRALGPKELRSVMGVVPQNRSGLVAYWKLDEGQGVEAKDRSGKEHHGKVWGAAWSDEGPYCMGNQIF